MHESSITEDAYNKYDYWLSSHIAQQLLTLLYFPKILFHLTDRKHL